MESIREKLQEADQIIKECASLRGLQKAYYSTLNSDQVNKRRALDKALTQGAKVDIMIKEYYGKNTKI